MRTARITNASPTPRAKRRRPHLPPNARNTLLSTLNGQAIA
jgi:hypothetical protein